MLGAVYTLDGGTYRAVSWISPGVLQVECLGLEGFGQFIPPYPRSQITLDALLAACEAGRAALIQQPTEG